VIGGGIPLEREAVTLSRLAATPRSEKKLRFPLSHQSLEVEMGGVRSGVLGI